jgi:hypothetical protein
MNKQKKPETSDIKKRTSSNKSSTAHYGRFHNSVSQIWGIGKS